PGLGLLELVELAPGFRVEPGVVERQADLVRGGLQERDLDIREGLGRPPGKRQDDQDASTALQRDADEAADPLPLDDRPLGGRDRRRLAGRTRAVARAGRRWG